MKEVHKRFAFAWGIICGLFLGSSVLLYCFVGGVVTLPYDRYIQALGIVWIPLGAAFKPLLEFLDPLASVRSYAIEMCNGNLEAGNRLRVRHHKMLRIPNAVPKSAAQASRLPAPQPAPGRACLRDVAGLLQNLVCILLVG